MTVTFCGLLKEIDLLCVTFFMNLTFYFSLLWPWPLYCLQERRDELEGLDLAIERQQKNLKNLKAEERKLQFERQAAREDLEFERDQNSKKKR